MSTGLIIAIVVIAIVLIALAAFVLPRARHAAEVRSRQRELDQRRERVAGEHRTEAEQRAHAAEEAEHKARIAEQEARRERAEADLHTERATLHERGMADHELVEEHERDRFAETSALRDDPDATVQRGAVADADRDGRTDYEQGRIDERTER